MRLVLSLVLMVFCWHAASSCSSGNYPFEKFLGTRTPYRLVGNKTFGRFSQDGCQATKIWLIVRHGTRNPSSGHIDLMKERLPKIKDLILKLKGPNEFITNRDLDLFRKWKTKLDSDDETKLVHEGEDEMVIMAERFQSRFPELFEPIYSNSSYKFKYTYSQRTRKSALSFAKGLFGSKTAKDVYFPDPDKKDPILRFYKNCAKWYSDIKKNSSAMKEATDFERSSQMKQVLRNVEERLQAKGKLQFDDIRAMFVTCSFETAWNRLAKSPWCSPFSVEDLKVLEYADDLRYFWQDGYGHELTYKQACPAFGDMMDHLNSTQRLPKVVAYFTHSGTILKLLAHLGLYKDQQKLTGKNFSQMKDQRLWRTSLIDCFASNLAFVGFNCKGTPKMMLMHQENVVRLPSCPESDLCDLSVVNEFYSSSLESCDFAGMCRNS